MHYHQNNKNNNNNIGDGRFLSLFLWILEYMKSSGKQSISFGLTTEELNLYNSTIHSSNNHSSEVLSKGITIAFLIFLMLEQS